MLRLALKEAGKQAPSLVVLAAVVWMFLGAIEQNNSFMGRLAASCHVNQQAATKAILENTKMLGRVERLFDEAIKVLARRNGR